MSNKEVILRSLVGLGQSIPKDKRIEVFSMLSNWLETKQGNKHIDTTSYLNQQNPDIQKSINLIKNSLTDIDFQTGMTLLQYAPLLTNVIEDFLNDQRQHEDHIQYITTQPEYFRETKHAAAKAPLWGGTLFDSIRQLIRKSDNSIDIINPYWSIGIVDALFKDFDKSNIHIRVLTLLSEGTKSSNYLAVEKIKKFIIHAGSTIEIYSPTIEQISRTNTKAPIHAKLILSDRKKVYVGSANLSKGGLDAGLEIGLVHTGPTVNELAEYCDWIYSNSIPVM